MSRRREALPPEVVVKEVSYGGWYIRGDLGYRATEFRDAEYWTYTQDDNGSPDFDADDLVIVDKNGKLEGDLDESFSAGLGIGYQVNKHLRTDLTLDRLFESDFEGYTEGTCADALGSYECRSDDRSSMSAWLLLANAYVELGTYHGFTPYVGAGIGGAHVEWDKLKNSIDFRDGSSIEVQHEGGKDWRFAWALMAGTSYCLTQNLNLDVGYRFARIEGDEMFGFAGGAGPGDDDGFHVHEGRAGLRYQFGGGNPACGDPEVRPTSPSRCRPSTSNRLHPKDFRPTPRGLHWPRGVGRLGPSRFGAEPAAHIPLTPCYP